MPNLAQVSNVTTERGRQIFGLQLENNPILRWLDANNAFRVDATEYQYRVYMENGTLKRRPLFGSYASENIRPGTPLSGVQAFLGDQIDIDASHIRDARLGLLNLDMWLDNELTSRGIGFAEDLSQALLQGDPGVVADDITGLLTLLDGTAIPGMGAFTGVIDAADWAGGGATSFDLTDEANWGAFIRFLMIERARVGGANGLLTPPELHAWMYSIAQEKHILGETRDQFGNPIATFGGVPFIEMNEGDIPTDEPDNAGTPNEDTTSLIIGRAGVGQLEVVTNSGFSFYDRGEAIDEELDEKPAQRVRWEFRGQWKAARKKSVRRIRNIKIRTS